MAQIDAQAYLALARQRLGQELGPTRWREVLQADIDAFGRATYDPDPMHVDPEWAARHSPFKGTIAFGFWTLSMLTAFLHEMAGGGDGGQYEQLPHEAFIGVNYGCDRLRFLEPVPVGARIRARGRLLDVAMLAPDRVRTETEVVVEIEGVEKPALIANWLSLVILPSEPAGLQGFQARGG